MERPKVGVGVLIFNDDKILLGWRKSKHSPNVWCPPGGHLEFGETPEETAVRETREEAGLEIKNVRRGPYTNDIFAEQNTHYITLFVFADYVSGTARAMEPESFELWKWFPLTDLPQPLFFSLQNLLDSGIDLRQKS